MDPTKSFKRGEKHAFLSIFSKLGGVRIIHPLQVVVVGTAPFIRELGVPLTSFRRAQLKRIRRFLNLQTVKIYTSSSGKRKCVHAPVFGTGLQLSKLDHV